MTEDEYFDALWARRGTAITPFQKLIDAETSVPPRPNECHQNVDRWVKEHPGCTSARGWLLTHHCFTKHSVVRDPGGNLIEITPMDPVRSPLPFLAHIGDLKIWEVMRNQVFWPPAADLLTDSRKPDLSTISNLPIL